MTAILHLVGGPADGKSLAWHDCPPRFYIPVPPPIGAITGGDLKAFVHHGVYERRGGGVAREAVYDWKPELSTEAREV